MYNNFLTGEIIIHYREIRTIIKNKTSDEKDYHYVSEVERKLIVNTPYKKVGN